MVEKKNSCGCREKYSVLEFFCSTRVSWFVAQLLQAFRINDSVRGREISFEQRGGGKKKIPPHCFTYKIPFEKINYL